MRRILLCDKNAAFFDQEMMPLDYDFLFKHKDTFRRMWCEQGKTFWQRYVTVFRSFIVKYSPLGDLPGDVRMLAALDYAFLLIKENFLDGNATQARNLLYNIAILGKNKHKFAFLDCKSLTKDPFYTKDTRDTFRAFFGPATDKYSYVKVFTLTPVYMRFGRSIVYCLEMWIDAPEMDPTDDSYYTPPTPLEQNAIVGASSEKRGVMCQAHQEECHMKYYQQFVVGNPNTPIAMQHWGTGDPRRCEPQNPLFDPSASPFSDWRTELSYEKFQDFYMFCLFKLAMPEHQCADCNALTKKYKKKLKKKLKREVLSLRGEVVKSCTCSNTKSTQTPKDMGAASQAVCKCGAFMGLLGCGGDSNNTPCAPKPKRDCFTCNSVKFITHETIHILSGHDPQCDGTVECEIATRTDPTTGCYEKRIMLKKVEVSELRPMDKTRECHQILGCSQTPPLNANHVRQLVPGLLAEFHWAEGSNWCASSIDYSIMDGKGDIPPTKFILKISGPNVFVAKEAAFAVLRYIAQRKHRPSVGWVLAEHDLFAWFHLLKKEDLEMLESIVFTISTGMCLDDAITPMEERTRAELPVTGEIDAKTRKAIEDLRWHCTVTEVLSRSRSEDSYVDPIAIGPDYVALKIRNSAVDDPDESDDDGTVVATISKSHYQSPTRLPNSMVPYSATLTRVMELQTGNPEPFDSPPITLSLSERHPATASLPNIPDPFLFGPGASPAIAASDVATSNVSNAEIPVQSSSTYTKKKRKGRKKEKSPVPHTSESSQVAGSATIKSASDSPTSDQSVQGLIPVKLVTSDKLGANGLCTAGAEFEWKNGIVTSMVPYPATLTRVVGLQTGNPVPFNSPPITVSLSERHPATASLPASQANIPDPFLFGPGASPAIAASDVATSDVSNAETPVQSRSTSTKKKRKGRKKEKSPVPDTSKSPHATGSANIKSASDSPTSDHSVQGLSPVKLVTSDMLGANGLCTVGAEGKWKNSIIYSDPKTTLILQKLGHLAPAQSTSFPEQSDVGESISLGQDCTRSTPVQDSTKSTPMQDSVKSKPVLDFTKSATVLDFTKSTPSQESPQSTLVPESTKSTMMLESAMPAHVQNSTESAPEQDSTESAPEQDSTKYTPVQDCVKPAPGSNSMGSRPLKACANCKAREPAPKKYKKCQRCKDEGVQEARYYCGRQCQNDDWVARHRDEHQNKTPK